MILGSGTGAFTTGTVVSRSLVDPTKSVLQGGALIPDFRAKLKPKRDDQDREETGHALLDLDVVAAGISRQYGRRESRSEHDHPLFVRIRRSGDLDRRKQLNITEHQIGLTGPNAARFSAG